MALWLRAAKEKWTVWAMEKGILGFCIRLVQLGVVLAKRPTGSVVLFQFPKLHYTHPGSEKRIAT